MNWTHDPVVVCPTCHGDLLPQDAHLHCVVCDHDWSVRGRTPLLFQAKRVGRRDRVMRRMYDVLSPVHDPITEHVLPHLQGDAPDAVLRRRMVEALDLDSLTVGDDGVAHILEVGVGGGALIPYIAEALPAGVPVCYWGLDLSSGMLRKCRARLPIDGVNVRLVQADAAALPFAENSMARVIHVGALGTFADPEHALFEMSRVARPGSRVVVVDEELDTARSNRLRHRIAFKLLTFNQSTPQAPIELLPYNAENVHSANLSRFFYLLSFDAPRGHA
ncbi:MAG: methyltransferase domain-containing protein [Proteobacteria bacterium]|nr:methyltransferase domain-containing protein [Pseudomonadota bacterium]